MKAHEQNFSFIGNKGTIIVPFFQRVYVWKQDQWSKLLNDLLDSYEQKYTHFLGSIILKGNDSSSSLLIDGQQRATTFSILLRVIGEKLNNLDKHRNLQQCLFAQDGTTDIDGNYVDIPRIQHSRFDRKVFRSIILGIENTNQTSAIAKCYEYFSEQIEEYHSKKGSEELLKFLNKILIDKLFVIVDIDHDEDEQRIFDSINTSGLPLAKFDIVKNEIFSRCKDEKKAEALYDEYWIPIFEKDEDTQNFWDEEVLTGREKSSRADIFLHNFGIIEQIITPSSTLAKINESYKKHIKDKSDESLVEFIKKFTQYADIFSQLPFFYIEEEYSYSDTMKRFLQIIHNLQLSTFIPIGLFIELRYRQQKLSNKEYSDCLYFLEKYIIRRALCRLDTSGYNKTVSTLIQELSNSSDIYNSLVGFLSNLKADSDRFPSDKEISELSFEWFDTKLAKLLLFWIELKKRQQDKEYADHKEPLRYNFQLEHIMPRSWGKHWKLPIINTTLELFDKELLDTGKISKSIHKMSDYEYIEELNKNGYDGEKIHQKGIFRSMKINELGNYTILSGKLNNSLKNYEWQRKLHGEGNKKGINGYSTLFLNREICDTYANEWTEDTITERTQKLKEHIIKIW